MNQIPLDVLFELFKDPAAVQGIKTKNSKAGLFDEMFKKNISQGEWGNGLYADSILTGNPILQKNKTKANLLQGPFDQAAIPLVQQDFSRLPAHLIEKLTQYLKDRGWEPSQIEKLMAAFKDPQGSLQASQFMTKLLQGHAKPEPQKEALVIGAAEIPQVEELFLKAGLGAGQVKNLMEKSVSQKGEWSVEQLRRALSDLTGEEVSRKDLLTFFKAHRIAGDLPPGQREQQVQKIMSAMSADPDSPERQGLKNDLAQVLTAKGVPPQEVKKILEKLSIEQSRISNPQNRAPADSREAEALLKQLAEWSRNMGSKTGTDHLPAARQQEVMGTIRKGWAAKQKTAEADGSSAPGMSAAEAGDAIEMLKAKNQNADSTLNLKGDLLAKTPGDTVENILKNLKQTEHQGPFGQELLSRQAAGARGMQAEGAQSASQPLWRQAYELPHPIPKVLERLIWMAQSGVQKSRLSLSPPELGRLEIEVVMKQGHLQANLGTENPAVKELIEANLGQLKQQLSAQGVTVDQFQVMVGLNQHSPEQDRLAAGDRFQRRSGKQKEEASAADPVAEPAGETIMKNNLYQIDVHV